MQKGVSPAVSYVLLLALVVIVSVAAYVWGNYEVQRLQDIPIAHNMESQMISVDQLVQAAAHGDTNFTIKSNLYYNKGVMQADAGNNRIEYSVELNANVYDKVTGSANASCDDGTYIIQDSGTGIKMTRMKYTHVFRGSTGDPEKQRVEIVACYDDVQINEAPGCKGKSGPRSVLTLRKVGYNAISGKPIVEVGIC